MNVKVQPTLLRWARERADLGTEELARMVGTKAHPAPITEGEHSGIVPVNKLRELARKTHAPFCMLFLPEPPDEPFPIKDFRCLADGGQQKPSLNLLETIYACQQRQAWMSEHLQAEGADRVDMVHSATIDDDPALVGAKIRQALHMNTDKLAKAPTTDAAVLLMLNIVGDAGVMIGRSGIVGTQTRRRLEPTEFKGFALSDDYAPLIFVNGNDWSASQMFTIAHECAHLALAVSAVPGGQWDEDTRDPIEHFCNQVAAAVLMPSSEMKAEWHSGEDPLTNARRLGNHFHVSSLALLVRARTLNFLSKSEFDDLKSQVENGYAVAKAAPRGTAGGSFYNNIGARLGKRFIREVLASTLEGKTLYSEAFDLLGTRKTDVFEKLVDKFLLGGRP